MRAYVYTRVYLQERMCKSACARAHVPSRLDRHVRMCASVGSQGCDARSRRGGASGAEAWRAHRQRWSQEGEGEWRGRRSGRRSGRRRRGRRGRRRRGRRRRGWRRRGWRSGRGSARGSGRGGWSGAGGAGQGQAQAPAPGERTGQDTEVLASLAEIDQRGEEGRGRDVILRRGALFLRPRLGVPRVVWQVHDARLAGQGAWPLSGGPRPLLSSSWASSWLCRFQ